MNIVHINLNARGGSERLALATIAALKEIDDIDIDLTTFQKPDLNKIQKTCGKIGLMALRSIKTVNIIRSIETVRLKKDYDLTRIRITVKKCRKLKADRASQFKKRILSYLAHIV